MTAQSRTTALTAALDDLNWLTTIPHRLGQVVGIYAETIAAQPMRFHHGASLDDILDVLRAGGIGPGRSKGDHADPTADAALAGHPAAVDGADETLGSIDHAVGMIRDAAFDLDATTTMLAGQPLRPHGPRRKQTRDEQLMDAVAALHHLRPNLEPAIKADPSSEGHLEWLIRVQLGESASWLRQKAEAIWVASKGERFQVAEQKPLPVCWVCGPWHVHDKSRPKAHPDGGGRCVECANFHSNHGVERTEAIWKRAQYGKGPTPAQMIEARAAGKSKKRKVRAG